MEERMKIMYNEHVRSPTHTVAHYISYLRRYVSQTEGQRSAGSDRSVDRTTGLASGDNKDSRPVKTQGPRSPDSISPLSYFIRKLKLDLKMSYPSFVNEFIKAPNNGLRLLLNLLKTLQMASLNPTGSVNRSSTNGTLKMDSYKQNMVDEQDCLLCVKYTLRIGAAVDEVLEDNSGLFTVTTCLLSNFSRSRIAALEILTLITTDSSSVDKVLDAFTSMRIKYGETTRFKMLINMMYTRGVSQVLFKVSCLRLLNTILNLSKSANMRVFLQYEMEEAGLDWKRIQECAQGDGLEYDDLRKEIHEWKVRYIDVDTILRKIKSDLRGEVTNSAVMEFNYDQHFGPKYRTAATLIDRCESKSPPASLWTDYGQCKQSTPEQVQRPIHSSKAIDVAQHEYENRNSYVPVALPFNQTLANMSNLNRGSVERSASSVVEESSNSKIDSSSLAYETKEVMSHRRNSVSSEIYDPYGLLIKTSSSDTSNPSRMQDRNWIFETPDMQSTSKKQLINTHQRQFGQSERHRASLESSIYDSGICVDSENIEPSDRTAKVFNEKSHRQVTEIRNSPTTSECRTGADRVSQERSANYTVDYMDDRLDNGLLRWYNPTPLSPEASSEQAQQNQTHGYKNGNLTKPRSPTPDYEYDSTDETNRPFSPHKSSTMKANLKATAARKLKQGFNAQYATNNKSSRNSNLHTPRGNHEDNKQIPRQRNLEQRRSDNHTVIAPCMSSKRVDKDMKIHENTVSSANQPALSSQLKTNVQKASVKHGMGESVQTASADSRCPASGHVGALSSLSRSTSASTDQHLNATNLRSYSPQYNTRNVSETPTASATPSQRETLNLKTSMSGKSKHMSRSLISLRVNDFETDASRNTNQNNSTKYHNTDMSRTGSRRSSVSEQKPIQEPARRNSLVIVTSITNINTDLQGRSRKELSSSGVDSIRSYSAEIGRVLSDLDQALERHGLEATLKTHQTQPRAPLTAYI
ncbi:hypothetical protein BsWGS_06321 [Bradybaena similaris]